MDRLHLQLRLRLPQPLQIRRVHLCSRPERRQVLHPAFRFQSLQHPHRIFLVHNLFGLIAAMKVLHRRNVAFLFARLIARLRLLIQRPAQPRHQPRCPNHPHRILNKPVIAHQSQLPVLNVRDAIQRVHQQPVRPLIQRERHRIGRKVSPPQVIQNRRCLHHRLARLRIGHAERAANLHPHIPRKAHKYRLPSLVLTVHDRPGLLQILLQLQRVAQHHHIQIPHRRPARQVANRPAHQEYREMLRPGYFTDGTQRCSLTSGKTMIQKINVVGHNLRVNSRSAPTGGHNYCKIKHLVR